MRYAALCICAFVLFCCSTSEKDTYIVETVDGVHHIHNKSPLWGDEPQVKLEFVQQIGELESEDEDYQLFGPTDLTVDENGRLYILNSLSDEIKVYDRTGTYVKTLCREGQGPGELEKPVSIDVDRDENFYIPDFAKNRVLRIDSDGNETARISLGEFRVNTTRVLPHGTLVVACRNLVTQSTEALNRLKMFDSTGTFLKSIVKPAEYDSDYLTDEANTVYFDVSGDAIVASFRNRNRIEKYSPDGELLLSVSRELGYDVPEPYLHYFTENSFRPVMEFVSRGVSIDKNDRIWVLTHIKSTADKETSDLRFEIFDSNGVLLQRLKTGHPVSRFRIIDNRLFIVDSKQKMAVYEYRIVDG